MEWDTAKRLVQDAENGSSPQGGKWYPAVLSRETFQP
jgi:hypothetical protein